MHARRTFFARLVPFLEELPPNSDALEVRNKYFVNERLLDILRRKNIAFALIDHPWMTPVAQLASKFDVVTADFTYIRWLGDRKGIEERTKNWDANHRQPRAEMRTWIPVIRPIFRARGMMGYFNNHYAGFGPGSIELFGKSGRVCRREICSGGLRRRF